MFQNNYFGYFVDACMSNFWTCYLSLPALHLTIALFWMAFLSIFFRKSKLTLENSYLNVASLT